MRIYYLGSALGRFFEALEQGDPFAYCLLGFVGLLILFAIVIFILDRREKQKSKAKSKGRSKAGDPRHDPFSRANPRARP